MKQAAPPWVVEFLGSGDPRREKRALQALCDWLEDSFPVDVTTDPRVRGLLPRLKSSDDVLVRRWLYKLVGLVHPRGWSPFMKGQVEGSELDAENLTWAVGGYSMLAPPSELRRAVEAGGHAFSGAVELAPQYFRPGAPVQEKVLRAVMNNDDDLEHKWLSLLHGKTSTLVSKDVIVGLNRHPSPEVSEYSIWSLYRDPAGRLVDVAIAQHEVLSRPPNVRRWYFRMLAKDPEDLWPNHDLLEYVMNEEPSARAREGLALGLAYYPDETLAGELVEWYEREEDALVRAALVRHFDTCREADDRYRIIVDHERAPRSAGGDSARTFAVQPPETRGTALVEHLTVVGQEDVQAHVVAVDVVGFSLLYDIDQVHVFQDLLAELSNADVVRAARPEELIHLLTGDGFIVAFLGPDRRLDPLRLALALQRVHDRLRNYKVRFGVHAGPARLLALSDGSRQLISGAINWSVRVMGAMGAAGEGRILVSDEYYSMYVKGAVEQFPGHEFAEVTGETETTKHRELVRAYEVRRSA